MSPLWDITNQFGEDTHHSVVELRITKTIVEPDIELIKADATLKDGSVLCVPEVAGAGFRDYS